MPSPLRKKVVNKRRGNKHVRRHPVLKFKSKLSLLFKEESEVSVVTLCKYCNKGFSFPEFALEIFLHGLQLRPVTTEGIPETPVLSATGSAASTFSYLEQSKAVRILIGNQIPLSCELGLKIVTQNCISSRDKEDNVHEYNNFCNQSKMTISGNTSWATRISQKMKFKKGEHVHKYSFGRTQRTARNSELLLGLSKKSWKDFNKCKQVALKMPRLSDQLISKLMTNQKPNLIKEFLRRKKLEVQLTDVTKSAEFSIFMSKKRLQVQLPDITTTPIFLKLFKNVDKRQNNFDDTNDVKTVCLSVPEFLLRTL